MLSMASPAEFFNALRLRLSPKFLSMAAPAFTFIDPPFDFNSQKYATIPPEVTGNFILRTAAHRLGFRSFSGKRLLDFGCGVRLARTIINLGLDVGFYAGADLNKDAIAWLSTHIRDSRFSF